MSLVFSAMALVGCIFAFIGVLFLNFDSAYPTWFSLTTAIMGMIGMATGPPLVLAALILVGYSWHVNQTFPKLPAILLLLGPALFLGLLVMLIV